MSKPWYSAVLSMSICIVVAVPFFIFVIDAIKQTKEQIDFCSQPNVICDSFSPVIMIGSIITMLILYFILTWIFDNYIPLQKFQKVDEK